MHFYVGTVYPSLGLLIPYSFGTRSIESECGSSHQLWSSM